METENLGLPHEFQRLADELRPPAERTPELDRRVNELRQEITALEHRSGEYAREANFSNVLADAARRPQAGRAVVAQIPGDPVWLCYHTGKAATAAGAKP
jgi:hypothetical protein